MIIKFTDQEKKEVEAFNAKYEQAFAENERLSDSLRPIPWPPGKEWHAARDKQFSLMSERAAEWRELTSRCEQRQFAELGGDPGRILADAKAQMPELLKHNYEYLTGVEDNSQFVTAGGLLRADPARDITYTAFHLHVEALRPDTANYNLLIEYINQAIRDSEYVEHKPLLDTKKRPARAAVPAQLTIWDSVERMGYFPMTQSRSYNLLAHNLAAPVNRVDMYRRPFIERAGLQIRIDGLPDSIKRLPASAAKLLDLLQIQATRGGMKEMTVKLPLREYMKTCGLTDEKEARRQVKRNITFLQGANVKFQDKKRGWLSVSLYGGTSGISNSVIGFKFNEDWVSLFPFQAVMYLPKGLFATNDKYNPHSYYFGRTIAEHRRMNDGDKNESTISVKTLVKASPTFPTYESIGEKLRVSQQIIEPFERDMDAAAAAGGKFHWHYLGINADDSPATYDEFINATVFITWKEYPPTETIKKGRAAYKKLQGKKMAGKKGATGQESGPLN